MKKFICKDCEKARNNKLEQLNDYIIENLNMELMDNRITKVTKTIESWEKVIKSEEFKKYKGYDCLYSTDYEHGGCWGQGFIIIDKKLNYVGFIRTI